MTGIVHHDAQHASLPTEESPEQGVLTAAGVELAQAEFWVDGEDFVIRSIEFPVISGGVSFEDALCKFGDSVVDFAVYLSEIETLTADEARMLETLVSRIVRMSQELEGIQEAENRKLLQVKLSSRRRGHHVRQWLPRSGQPTSRAPLPV